MTMEQPHIPGHDQPEPDKAARDFASQDLMNTLVDPVQGAWTLELENIQYQERRISGLKKIADQVRGEMGTDASHGLLQAMVVAEEAQLDTQKDMLAISTQKPDELGDVLLQDSQAEVVVMSDVVPKPGHKEEYEELNQKWQQAAEEKTDILRQIESKYPALYGNIMEMEESLENPSATNQN